MKLTIESTSQLLTIDGVPARVWEGQTENGIPVTAFITRVAVAVGCDATEFERELAEARAPSHIWPDRLGLAVAGLTQAELGEWRKLAAALSLLMEGHEAPWANVGSILERLLDAVDALTAETPRQPADETRREPAGEEAPSGTGVQAAIEVVEACSRAIGLVARYSDELKMTFAATLIRQLAFDLAARAELTPRELMIQMAHRALGVYRVGPGEVVR